MAADPSQSHGAGAAHTTTTEAEHGSGGLPQFQFEHWGGQIAYLLVLFVVLYVLVSRVFAPRMRRATDERASTIDTALKTAQQVQAEAEDQAKAATSELAEARAQAQKLAVDARAKSSADAAARAAIEDAKVAEHIAHAEARIAGMRESAMASVGTVAMEATSAIVEKLTGKAPADADVKAALAARGGVA